MKKLEDFTYSTTCCLLNGSVNGSKCLYKVLSSLHLRPTTLVTRYPVMYHEYVRQELDLPGLDCLTLFDILKAILPTLYEPFYDFEFDKYCDLIFNIPFKFDLFQLRTVFHGDVNCFDIHITPFHYVDN